MTGYFPQMMQAPGMAAAPCAYRYQPLPPAGLVNLDVDTAPGFVTLDTDYPFQVGVPSMGTLQEFSQMRPQAPLPSGRPEAYTVQKGDTIYKIAKRFGTTMRAIIQTNNLRNPNLILPGQVLYIPYV